MATEFNQFKDAEGGGIYNAVERVLFQGDPEKTKIYDDVDQDPMYAKTNDKIEKITAQMEEIAAKYGLTLDEFLESDLAGDEGDASDDVEVVSTTPDEEEGSDEEEGDLDIAKIHVDVPEGIDTDDVTVTIAGQEFEVDDENGPLEVEVDDDIDTPGIDVDLPDNLSSEDISVQVGDQNYVVDKDAIENDGEGDDDFVADLMIDDEAGEEETASEASIEEGIKNILESYGMKAKKKDALAEVLSRYGVINEGDADVSVDVEDDDSDLESSDEVDVDVDETGEEVEADVDELEDSGEESEETDLEEGDVDIDVDEDGDELGEVEGETEEDIDVDVDVDSDELGDEGEEEEPEEGLEEGDAEAGEGEDELGEVENEEGGEGEEEEEPETADGEEAKDAGLSPEEVKELDEAIKLLKHHLVHRVGGKDWKKIYKEGDEPADEEPEEEDIDIDVESGEGVADEGAPEEDEITVDDNGNTVEEVVSSNGENSEDIAGDELTDVAEGTKGSVSDAVDMILESYFGEGDTSYTNYGPNAGVAVDTVGGPSYIKTGDPNHPSRTTSDLDDSKYYGGRKNVKVQAGNSASAADMSDVAENLAIALGKAGTMQPNGKYTAEGTYSKYVVHVDDLNQIIKPISEVCTHNKNLPLAENVGTWNAHKSSEQIKALAYKNRNKANLDLMKATHLYYVNEGKNPEDYQFPIAMIIENKVYAIPQAIENAAQVFASPIYTKKFDEATLANIRASIDFYMNKMGKETAWKNGTCVQIVEGKNLTGIYRSTLYDPYKMAEFEIAKEKAREAKKLLSD